MTEDVARDFPKMVYEGFPQNMVGRHEQMVRTAMALVKTLRRFVEMLFTADPAAGNRPPQLDVDAPFIIVLPIVAH